VTSPVRAWRERDGRLLRIRLSRPKANVLDAEMIAALDEAFAVAAAEGPHFSFGASVEEHLPAKAPGMLRSFHALVLRVLACPVPVLVAVRGQCLGGGLELATAGGLLLAARDAKLGQPEIQLGVFAPAASVLLPERIGPGAAGDLLLSGRSVDAAEALRLGLVDAVEDDPEAAALAWFDAHLARKSASSLRLAVQAARGGLVERARARLAEVEALYVSALLPTRDATEGLNAFLEKRAARWEDR
jgi:cyclohexa-1,5-dienecarbonyl-CoA hydratase